MTTTTKTNPFADRTDINELLDEYALVNVKESQAYDYFVRGPGRARREKEHRKICAQAHKLEQWIIERLRELGFKGYINRTISGHDPETDHYEIDDALAKAFPGAVAVDSESGQFYAYTNDVCVDLITDWLSKKFPGLKWTVTKDDEIRLLGFGNWTASEKWLKERGVEIPKWDFDKPGERVVAAGKIKRIHVNQHNIRANKKDGGNRPCVTAKLSGENIRCQTLAIVDEEGNDIARVVYSPDKPLSCGARVWVETKYGIRAEGIPDGTDVEACPPGKDTGS